MADKAVQLAAIAETREPSPAIAAAAAEPITELPSPAASIAATRIATLGGPAVIIDEKTARPDRSAVQRRAAQRARERRRIARRARLAREAALAALQQQQANPFEPAPVARATR